VPESNARAKHIRLIFLSASLASDTNQTSSRFLSNSLPFNFNCFEFQFTLRHNFTSFRRQPEMQIRTQIPDRNSTKSLIQFHTHSPNLLFSSSHIPIDSSERGPIAERLNIMRNIGFTFVRLNQFAEASSCFEYVLQERGGSCEDAFHQLVCQTSIGDTNAMQTSFVRMLELTSRARPDLHSNAMPNDSDDDSDSDDDLEPELTVAQPDEPEDLNELLRRDTLSERRRHRQSAQQWQVLNGAKLIAPRLNAELSVGYQWCERQVAACFSDVATVNARFEANVDSQPSLSDARNLLETIGNRRAAELLGRLELARAERLLQARQLNDASRVLSQFERLDGVRELAGAAADRALRSVRAAALTNLSFVCLVSGQAAEAEQHARSARALDPMHVGAMVNEAAARLALNQAVDAKPLLQEALLQDANCVPALFNLALCNRRLGRLQDALRLLLRVNSLLSSHEYVLFQIAQM
jgi:intraflagellar transport protein 88